MTTTYRITATWIHCGARLDCTDSASLGDELWSRFSTKEEAQAVADRLQSELAQYDLDPTTRYAVEEAE